MGKTSVMIAVAMKIRRRASRVRGWLTAPLARGEAARAALFAIAAVLVVGSLWHKEMAGAFAIAAICGGLTRLAGFFCASSSSN